MDPLDPEHYRHRDEDDGAGEEEEGAGEGLHGLIVHQAVQRPGEEGNEGAEKGEAGEYSADLILLHGLTEETFEIVTQNSLFMSHLKRDRAKGYFG